MDFGTECVQMYAKNSDDRIHMVLLCHQSIVPAFSRMVWTLEQNASRCKDPRKEREARLTDHGHGFYIIFRR
jgi:hypothetical protein